MDEELKIGSVSITPPGELAPRFNLLLWGSAKCGKTTLASTAPGKLLWINFDADGTIPLMGREDVLVMDLANSPDRVVEEFKTHNSITMRGLDKLLAAEPIHTVVFDSVTSFRDKTFLHGVLVAASTKKGAGATIEDPGQSGWGNVNVWIRLAVKNLLELTGRHNCNTIVISHEDKPTKDDKGNTLYISMMLGSSLNGQIPVNINEIWWMRDDGKQRSIAVRPVRLRKPMGTRMFDTSKAAEFVWNYDADKQKGEGIADWIDRWKTNKFRKITLPGTK